VTFSIFTLFFSSKSCTYGDVGLWCVHTLWCQETLNRVHCTEYTPRNDHVNKQETY